MLVPVILSGGAGTRLWPVSRSTYPKPFMRLGDGASLLQRTLARALTVASAGEVLTVTAKDHHFLTRDEYSRHPEAASTHLRFLLEPAGRNTAPAIALAALDVARRHGPSAQLLVMPSDHLISDLAAFAHDVAAASALADDGYLVTFGIRPSAPETGFGYIEAGDAIAERGGRLIEAFVEKPDIDTAKAYLASGNYFWNAGMFCFRADAFLAACQAVAPDVLHAATACFEASATEAEPLHFAREAFLAQPDISIDYAVMERAAKRAVVPASFDWNDIGSWKAVSELGDADARGNRVQGGAIVIESDNCYIESGTRVVAAVGVRNLVIIDAGDAVLVADRDQTQSVKQVVDALRASSHEAASHHRTVLRPWGSYTILEDADDCKVKRLTVRPGGILSLQMHHRRSEHWTVVTGVATVRIGDDTFELQRNQSTYIPMGTLHRLENRTGVELHLIETQCGDYFGEDDIVRLEDVYGRI